MYKVPLPLICCIYIFLFLQLTKGLPDQSVGPEEVTPPLPFITTQEFNIDQTQSISMGKVCFFEFRLCCDATQNCRRLCRQISPTGDIVAWLPARAYYDGDDHELKWFHWQVKHIDSGRDPLKKAHDDLKEGKKYLEIEVTCPESNQTSISKLFAKKADIEEELEHNQDGTCIGENCDPGSGNPIWTYVVFAILVIILAALSVVIHLQKRKISCMTRQLSKTDVTQAMIPV